MKKSSFTKILTLIAVVAITAVASVAGTLAYLTDRDSKANVFTVGNVSIRLDEEFDQGATLLPGIDIEKKPTITNTGKNDAWVWAEIAIPSALDNDDASKNVIHFNYTKESVADGLWSWQDADGNWLVKENVDINGDKYNVYTVLYGTALKPTETTKEPVMTKVYMDTHVDIDTNGDWHFVSGGEVTDLDWNSDEDGNPVIYVSAYAIQKDGFETVGEAYAAYQTQWADNGTEYAEVPTIFTYEGVNYVTSGTDVEINSVGGDTLYRGVISDGKTTATSVEIGEGIVRLNNRSICKAPTIKSVQLPTSLTYIDESAFQQSGITSIEIPENVTYIGKQAFGSCGELETIVIKAKDVTFGNYIARACANLKEVYIYSDSIEFETGSMYFTNKENADTSGITFYVSSQEIADEFYAANSTSHSYGMLIKSLDGKTTYYDTLK